MSGKPYPTAPPANTYLGQTAYPAAQYPQHQYQTASPYQQTPYGQPAGGMYGGPPPYTSQPQEPPPPYTPYPGQMPMYGNPQQGVPPQPTYPQQQAPTVMVPGLYDASARFDSIAQPRIPPPPPGVAPNAAQMAAMQGHTVIGTQQRSNWFTGSSSGGDWGL